MKFFKLKIEQRNELKNLINSIYKSNAPLNFINVESIIVCIENDSIIGFACYQKSELHCKVVTVEVGVIESKRRNGIGKKLHQKLLELFPLSEDKIGIDGCCYSTNSSAKKFLKSLGYSKYLDCNILFVDTQMKLETLNKYSIKPLGELYNINQNFKDKVKQFYISRYTEEHKWNPVTLDKAVWDNYYDDGNSKELGVAILKNDDIIGCSFAYTGFEEDDVLGIGGTYSSSLLLEEQIDLVKALFAYQLEKASFLGHNTAYIEVDSTESISSAILSWLPIKKKQIFERHRLSLN